MPRDLCLTLACLFEGSKAQFLLNPRNAAKLDQIRGELNDALVAARLVDADLARRKCAGDDAERSAAIWEANSRALARALGYDEWESVAKIYRAGEISESNFVGAVNEAHCALERFARSKRSAVRQRWRNMLRGNSSR